MLNFRSHQSWNVPHTPSAVAAAAPHSSTSITIKEEEEEEEEEGEPKRELVKSVSFLDTDRGI
jgi:hypothetical protein